MNTVIMLVAAGSAQLLMALAIATACLMAGPMLVGAMVLGALLSLYAVAVSVGLYLRYRVELLAVPDCKTPPVPQYVPVDVRVPCDFDPATYNNAPGRGMGRARRGGRGARRGRGPAKRVVHQGGPDDACWRQYVQPN
jgi:hypothetical protein